MTSSVPHPQRLQSASEMCDNFLEELHDILKEYGESEDYRFVEAVADLHERVLLWKERPDVIKESLLSGGK